MWRRFLQRLEQGVEAVTGQHVNFVDDINLVTAPARCVLHRFQQFAGIIHPGFRGGIDFQHIHETAFVEVDTAATYTTRR